MAKDKDNVEESNFPKKLRDLLPAEFESELESAESEEVKKKIVEFEEEIHTTQLQMEADTELEEAKQKVKDLSSGYKDVIKTHQAMIKYSLYVLRSRGAL